MVKTTRKRRNIKIGNYKDFNIVDVRERAILLRQQIASGLDPMQEQANEIKRIDEENKQRLKTGDLLELYYEKHTMIHKRLNTQKWDRGQIDKYLKPMLGNLYASELDLPTLIDFYNEVQSKTSFSTANHLINLISSFWNWGEKYKYFPLNSNPVRHVPKGQDKPLKINPLTLDEYKKLLTAIEDGFTRSPYNPRMFRALKLLMLTGCRTTEITKLRKANVNLEERFIYLDQSKNDVEKMPIGLPVVEEFRKALEESPKDSEMLFPATRGGLDAVMDLRKAHKWALERAGLRHMRKHDFRHSFISIGTDVVGASIQAVQKTVGHKKVSTTERYSHLKDKTRLDTADAIAMAIMG
jgi:integrase